MNKDRDYLDDLFDKLSPAETDQNLLKVNEATNAEFQLTKKMFNDAKRTLEAIRRFENGDYKHRIKMRTGENMKDYLKRTRKQGREQLLNKLVPERICPVCKIHKPRSKQWTILHQGSKKIAICKSCVAKQDREKFIPKHIVGNSAEVQQLEERIAKLENFLTTQVCDKLAADISAKITIHEKAPHE